MCPKTIRVHKLTIEDYDEVAEVVGESQLLEASLKSLGFNIAIYFDNKIAVILVIACGKKPKHAYICEVWTDGSKLAKRYLYEQMKLVHELFKGWTMYFTAKSNSHISRHSVLVNAKLNLYRYTAVDIKG